jgi:hypothetical protein
VAEGAGAEACSISVLGGSQSPVVHGRVNTEEAELPGPARGSSVNVERSPADEYGRAGGPCGRAKAASCALVACEKGSSES